MRGVREPVSTGELYKPEDLTGGIAKSSIDGSVDKLELSLPRLDKKAEPQFLQKLKEEFPDHQNKLLNGSSEELKAYQGTLEQALAKRQGLGHSIKTGLSKLFGGSYHKETYALRNMKEDVGYHLELKQGVEQQLSEFHSVPDAAPKPMDQAQSFDTPYFNYVRSRTADKAGEAALSSSQNAGGGVRKRRQADPRDFAQDFNQNEEILAARRQFKTAQASGNNRNQAPSSVETDAPMRDVSNPDLEAAAREARAIIEKDRRGNS